MKTKHTKGEWIANPHGVNLYQVWVNDTKIAACDNNVQSTVYRQKTEDEMHANTQLIAAAPELLEALQVLKKLYGDRTDYIGEYKKAWDKADASIKKAIGE